MMKLQPWLLMKMDPTWTLDSHSQPPMVDSNWWGGILGNGDTTASIPIQLFLPFYFLTFKILKILFKSVFILFIFTREKHKRDEVMDGGVKNK